MLSQADPVVTSLDSLYNVTSNRCGSRSESIGRIGRPKRRIRIEMTTAGP